MRRGNRQIGRMLAQQFHHRLLVRRIGIRMQQADRHRIRFHAPNLFQRRQNTGGIERLDDLAFGADALVDLEPQPARHQRARFVPIHIVELRHAKPGDFQNIAKAPRREQRHPAPLPINNALVATVKACTRLLTALGPVAPSAKSRPRPSAMARL